MTDHEKARHILHSMDVCRAGFVCADCPLHGRCVEKTDLSVAELAHEYLVEVENGKD